MSVTMREFCLLCVVISCMFVRPSVSQLGECTKMDRCSCTYDDGVIVDLKGVAKTDGTPEWVNVSNSEGELFSWNPCFNFNYTYRNDSDCVEVAVCMIRNGIPKELIYDLGSEETGVFSVDENKTLKLTYTADKEDFKRQAVITLQCMPSSVFDFFVAGGEKDIGNDTIIYELTFASKHACAYAPNIGPPAQLVSNGLNGGEIFAIVLFTLIAAYVVFGMAYQVFVKKATGIEICPNHNFWCNLPLIRNACKSPKPTGNQYDSI